MLLSIEYLQLKNAPVHKLRKRFVGLFFIIKRIGSVAYELELPQTWKIHPIFHTSLLWPFRTSTWSIAQESAVDELELENDWSYEVEKLLRWRRTPADNFDYPKELQKMIDCDNPIEDTTVLYFRGRNFPRGS